MPDYMDGMYYALLEGRFLFDFVHEDDLGPENLKKYSALLLPNTALLSDEQCRQLRAYVEAGGSLLATFETSMYTERNQRRPDFGLADVFGIRQSRGHHRHERQRVSMRASRSRTRFWTASRARTGFPGAEFRLPVTPVEDPVLTVVPGYVAYPPELSYPPSRARTNRRWSSREKGKSRLVYFPGDVERTMWRSGHTDLSRLLQNSIRWVSGAESAGHDRRRRRDRGVRLGDPGWFRRARVELHQPRHAPGLDPEFLSHRRAEGEDVAAPGRRVTRVELLRAGTEIPFAGGAGTIEFTIPRVLDYEVAALYSA